MVTQVTLHATVVKPTVERGVPRGTQLRRSSRGRVKASGRACGGHLRHYSGPLPQFFRPVEYAHDLPDGLVKVQAILYG